MCIEWLGETIDIHGGGKDLIFPHHENEIAQSEAASGKAPFAKYWLHNGFVNIEKEKMSKSLGNILNIRDALAVNTNEAVRHFLLSSHYRSPIDYTTDSLREAEAAVERYYKTLQRIELAHPEAAQINPDESVIKERLTPFTEAMDDDFNTATVLGNIFKEISRANRLMDKGASENLATELSYIKTVLTRAAGLIGIFRKTPDEYFAEIKGRSTLAAEEVERLIKERDEARAKKDFSRADEIRDELLEKNIILEDTPTGTVWTVKG
jgi:cysteinyl-tRNA synthetase